MAGRADQGDSVETLGWPVPATGGATVVGVGMANRELDERFAKARDLN